MRDQGAIPDLERLAAGSNDLQKKQAAEALAKLRAPKDASPTSKPTP